MLKGGRVGDALDSGDVARIFKAMAQAAHLTPDEIARISGHSTRVGAAQDLVRYGVDLVGAMQAGRWKTSAMVARYSARLLAKRGGMAQIADRRVQFWGRSKAGLKSYTRPFPPDRKPIRNPTIPLVVSIPNVILFWSLQNSAAPTEANSTAPINAAISQSKESLDDSAPEIETWGRA